MSNVRVTRPYRKRRQYSPEFKAQLVAESQSPGAIEWPAEQVNQCALFLRTLLQ
ncbi:MAG: hypothetical protein RBR82_14420 [Pseudomonas sp.]|nr:hypothetical protein [Pseudomonas sp.]